MRSYLIVVGIIVSLMGAYFLLLPLYAGMGLHGLVAAFD